MNNPQPQVDVDAAVKALFAAGAKWVSLWRNAVMIGVKLKGETNPEGDAPRADVVAWINAELAAGGGYVHLRIDNDDNIDKVHAYFN